LGSSQTASPWRALPETRHWSWIIIRTSCVWQLRFCF